MTFTFNIPTPTGLFTINVEPGSSAVFVGANGGGKTRLAVQIEGTENLNTHRISAHRALSLNPSVPKISERAALSGLRTGMVDESANVHHRLGQRWQGKMAVSMLNDFDFLVQALFADQANISIKTHKDVRAGKTGPVPPTKFERLVEIWSRLLPHRQLDISGDDINVTAPTTPNRYKASEMSDGERAIFYLIGQTLAAAENSLLIFDEPELHVHRSIMARLWDELEAVRPDCAIIFITHDLEFASSRVAQKFVIRDYDPTPFWKVELVPEAVGFSEELTTLILGSRRPILFVEGEKSSIDLAIYRCCFPGWTVVPRGSCQDVIHSVVTMRRNHDLTRVTCSGIVDADDFQHEEIAYLRDLGIAVLTVSEIDNLILLPSVSRTIAENEGYRGTELEERLLALQDAVFATLSSPAAIDEVVTRYCRRRIDRVLKKIDFGSSKSVEALSREYRDRTEEFDISKIARHATDRLETAIEQRNLFDLLANYDNKGLLALASKHLKNAKLDDFKSWLARTLRNDQVPALSEAIRRALPVLEPK